MSVSENLVSEEISVLVSEKFDLGKKSWFQFRKIWYRKKSLGIGFGQNFGIVIQCLKVWWNPSMDAFLLSFCFLAISVRVFSCFQRIQVNVFFSRENFCTTEIRVTFYIPYMLVLALSVNPSKCRKSKFSPYGFFWFSTFI